jgi:CubicO group peptidase (beta-lactamase class C family)
MRRSVRATLLAVPALLAVAVSVAYWDDPVYWRRWWSLVTHTEPDYMDFRPLAPVGGGSVFELPRASPGGLTIDPVALREAEAYAEAFDSFALIVVHWGVIQSEWYGSGWSADRVTQSQSMAKTVAALMVGAALAQGAISDLNAPLATWLPEWRDDPRGAIPLRDLLAMTSGLATPRYSRNPFPTDAGLRFLLAADRTAALLRSAAAGPPGVDFEYNDLNAALAGLVVQRATGMPYATFVDAALWRPMGGQPAALWLDREGPGSLAMTACCLLAPAMDWARIGLLMKDRGLVRGVPVIPPAFIDAMTAPSAAYPGYGYFTWLGAGAQADPRLADRRELEQTEPFLAPDLFFLLGRGGQRVYVSRALDLVIVRLGPFSGFEPLKAGWDNARLPNIIVRGFRPGVAPDATPVNGTAPGDVSPGAVVPLRLPAPAGG